MDYHRRGAAHRGVLQPQIGPYIAGLLPRDIDIHVVNDTWEDPDWSREYDLLFLSSLHSDFDRARQISHYWRRRGAKTVFGGILASTYPQLCAPYFDAVAVGDPESTVPALYQDFCGGRLQPLYLGSPYDPSRVPTPRFELLAGKQLLPLTLEVTRGCPFTCEFCSLTGLGTRFHTRAIEDAVRDLLEGRRALRGLVPPFKLYSAVFNDNNLGGNPAYLRAFCQAIEPLKLVWGTAMSFNVLTDTATVQALSRSGCRCLFVGLESFSPEAIADMHKFQNAVEKTRDVIHCCRDHGILIESGLMVNPLTDDCAYLRSIPERLEQCGLHVPAFVCFECPIPGTPHFRRLSAADPPGFLPNALLRDFSAYTLVTRPRREPLDRFLDTYQWLLREVNSAHCRWRKLADDLPIFARRGYWVTALIDAFTNARPRWRPNPARTYVAGTDTPPPEASSTPFTDRDFDTEEQRRAILDPLPVTDAAGRVLPQWRESEPAFGAKGRLVALARTAAAR
jgi:hypothetical protein